MSDAERSGTPLGERARPRSTRHEYEYEYERARVRGRDGAQASVGERREQWRA